MLTLFAGWVVLPGGTLDVGSFKTDHPIQEGLDLQGGVQVLLEARPPDGQKIDSDTMAGTRDTIERRVGGLGVSEPVVQTRGSNQIIVELAGRHRSEASGRGRSANRAARDHRHKWSVPRAWAPRSAPH